jgi:hypothetical protein
LTLPLPEEQRQKLLALQAPPAVGDVWLLPKEHVRFPSGKQRRCLLVALEPADGPVRAHLSAGSGSPGGPPRIIVRPDAENGLTKKTYFRFRDPVEEFDIALLQSIGMRVGTVSETVRAEIPQAIQQSRLVTLKRLLRQVRSTREEGDRS